VNLRWILSGAACVLACFGTLHAFQKPWREYPAVEYNDFPAPADYNVPAEWVFARLMFPPGPLDGYSRTGRFTGDYRLGASLWTQDYPRADRHFARAIRRLTRIDARSVEQVVSLDDDDVYNWPFLYAVQAGEWGLTEKEGAKLRDYLLRGGFFMADDFHGTLEWGEFEKRIRYAFPDRSITEIEDTDPVLHSVYDIGDRPQIPGYEHLREGHKNDGIGSHWRAIRDDHNRIMIAISFNSDMGDAWEFADSPYYPEKIVDLAVRMGVNDVVYAMSH